MSEQVTITAAPPPLETQTATLGQVVTTRSIQNLPSEYSRSPGSCRVDSRRNSRVELRQWRRQRCRTKFLQIGFQRRRRPLGVAGDSDGRCAGYDAGHNRGVINPPVDSVQEFKVQAQSYDAQFGRTSGGIVNVITKSGTNEYHGVAYDFERHSVLDANNWFNNASNRQNFPRSSGTSSAAISAVQFIKSKWFAFGDYEGLRQGLPTDDIDNSSHRLAAAR